MLPYALITRVFFRLQLILRYVAFPANNLYNYILFFVNTYLLYI
jgi:hypothetical protein